MTDNSQGAPTGQGGSARGDMEALHASSYQGPLCAPPWVIPGPPGAACCGSTQATAARSPPGALRPQPLHTPLVLGGILSSSHVPRSNPKTGIWRRCLVCEETPGSPGRERGRETDQQNAQDTMVPKRASRAGVRRPRRTAQKWAPRGCRGRGPHLPAVLPLCLRTAPGLPARALPAHPAHGQRALW